MYSREAKTKRSSIRVPTSCSVSRTWTAVVGLSVSGVPSALAQPSVSRLADVYPISFAAVQKHVAVLERAGLVTKERRGREQLVRTDGATIGQAQRVLEELEAAWRGRVGRMADLLTQVAEPAPRKPSAEQSG